VKGEVILQKEERRVHVLKEAGVVAEVRVEVEVAQENEKKEIEKRMIEKVEVEEVQAPVMERKVVLMILQKQYQLFEMEVVLVDKIHVEEEEDLEVNLGKKKLRRKRNFCGEIRRQKK